MKLVKRILVTITVCLCWSAFGQKIVSLFEPETIETTVNFINKAVDFITKSDLYEACSELNAGVQWHQDDTTLVLFDSAHLIWMLTKGNAHLWSKDIEKVETLDDKKLVDVARELGISGGWVDFFLWDKTLVGGYFKNFTKNGVQFTLGAILFKSNPLDQAIGMVARARSYFMHHGLAETISVLNEPEGQFIYGRGFAVVFYNDQGVCLADGHDITRIGQPKSVFLDDNGKFVLDDFLTPSAQQQEVFTTVDNYFNKVRRTSVVSRVYDKTSKKFYYLSCGYFPDLNDTFVLEMAREAAELIGREGITRALGIINAFNEPKDYWKRPFNKARLTVVVYDHKGVMVANSLNPALSGTSALEYRDDSGRLIVQDIINHLTKENKAWIFHYQTNALQGIYGEKIMVPEGTFFVTVQGYTPVAKKYLAAAAAEGINQFLLSEPLLYVIDFLKLGADRGLAISLPEYADFECQIFDNNNYCIWAGEHTYKLWLKMSKGLSKYVQHLRKIGQKGGWTEYYDGIEKCSAYVQLCRKSASIEYVIAVKYRCLIDPDKARGAYYGV